MHVLAAVTIIIIIIIIIIILQCRFFFFFFWFIITFVKHRAGALAFLRPQGYYFEKMHLIMNLLFIKTGGG